MIVPPDADQWAPPSARAGLQERPQRSPAPGIDPALESQLRRERARRFGQSVREQLACKHSRSETAKRAALETRLVQQGPLLGSQVPPPPQPGSSTAVKARPAAGIPAVFPQRLEAKLAAALSPGPLAEHSSASLSRPRSPSQPSPSSQASSLSSMTTPSTAGSLDSLPSSWGLHASRKLRKLVRHQQRLGRMAPGGQDALGGGQAPDPFSEANLRRLFAPSNMEPRRQEQEQALQQQQQQLPQQAPVGRPAAGTDLAERLLRLESEGDPFSIINIYLDEQAQKQRAQQAKAAVPAAVPAAAAAKPPQPWQSLPSQLPPSGLGGEEEDRPSSAASDRENVSANVGRRARDGPGQPAGAALLGELLVQQAPIAAAAGSALAGTAQAPLLERAFQAELARLLEMQEAELDLAALEQSQLVGAAQREIESLEAAVEGQAAQHMKSRTQHPIYPLPAPAAQPTQGLAGSGAQLGAPPQHLLQLQLLSGLQLAQQQRLAQLQQQLALLQSQQSSQQPVAAQLAVPPALAPALGPTPGAALPVQQQSSPPQLRPNATPAATAAAAVAAPEQRLPPLPAASQQVQQVQVEPAAQAAEAATAAKQQLVQQWLESAESEEQYTEYSADPDHVADDEASSAAMTAAAPGSTRQQLQQPTPRSAGLSPPDAAQSGQGGIAGLAAAAAQADAQPAGAAALATPLSSPEDSSLSEGSAGGTAASLLAASSPPLAPAAAAPAVAAAQQLETQPAAAEAAPEAAAASPGNAPASPEQSLSKYSTSFEDDLLDAEISYSEQVQQESHNTTTLTSAATGPPGAAAAASAGMGIPAMPPISLGPAIAAAEAVEEQQQHVVGASPRQLQRPGSPPGHGARPSSPSSSHQRPASPHVLDDRYPTPRASHQSDSRPGSPLLGSRPGSPLGAVGDQHRSPPFTPRSASPDTDHPQLAQPLPSQPGEAPQPQPQRGNEVASLAAGVLDADEPAAAAEPAVRPAADAWAEEHHQPAPPPAAALLPDDPASPGSPRVEDSTVVQSKAHARQYVEEVLDYFWEHRVAAYTKGEQPLDLDGFLALERQRPPVGDPQHIYNKLLFDACNEALAQYYNRALTSFAGRLALERTLTDRPRVSQFVAGRVLGWAGMGCTGAELRRMLAEDAAEEELTLKLLTDMMVKEAAAGEARSPPASLSPGHD